MAGHDDPEDLARIVLRCPRPLLIGLDVDGVLAPLVDHADDAQLLDGVADAIRAVAALDGVRVAVISGRSIKDLERFGFGHDVDVIGSHGTHTRDRPLAPLDAQEQARLDRLDVLATDAARSAGDGAWVERKPTSVVLHVRQASPPRGRAAVDALAASSAAVEGAITKAGSDVLELIARGGDKGTAIVELRDRLGAATTVFVGDDLTDEDAFARLGASDVAIKVGGAATIAPYRLADPPAVLRWLHLLTP